VAIVAPVLWMFVRRRHGLPAIASRRDVSRNATHLRDF